MCALALEFETILVAPPVGSLEQYLGALLADEKKCSLGAGGGRTIKKGAPRRSKYLMPRVARRVRDHRDALLSLLEEGRLAAMVATQDEDEDDDAVAGETRGSAKKPRLKEMVADLSSTAAHLGANKRYWMRNAWGYVRDVDSSKGPYSTTSDHLQAGASDVGGSDEISSLSLRYSALCIKW